MHNNEIVEKSVNNLKKAIQEKYGKDSYFQTDEFKQYMQKYSQETYGTDFITQAPINREKNRKGMLEHGVENIKKTCQERYHADFWAQSKEGKEKISSYDVQKKQHDTRVSKKIYSSSKEEDLLYEKIKEYFPDIIHNYFSDEYPFNCDFYIPSYKLYIEYQGSWMHGGHPYDKNNLDDINKVQQMQLKANEKRFDGKKKSSYLWAIHTWTESDVKKREHAKNNNLNYLEIYPAKNINYIDIIINFINNIKNNR